MTLYGFCVSVKDMTTPHTGPSPENITPREILTQVVEEAALVYLGIKGFIAERRMDGAGDRMERMDHKDALYYQLGSLAIDPDPDALAPYVETATGLPPHTRSFAERFMDKRMEKRSWNEDLKAAERKKTVKAYGGQYAHTMGLGSTIDTANRVHASRMARRHGVISARELRGEESFVRGSVRALENSEQKRTRRELKGASNKNMRSARQPILTEWRELRRNGAIKGIKKHHLKAERFKSDANAIRSNKETRAQARDAARAAAATRTTP